MAKVPYQPIPEETLDPSTGIDAPASAFGVQVAQALQGVGRELQGAGDTLFSRALEMQKLKIEADVNDKVTQSLLATGKLDNEFRKLSGDQPQAALERHTGDLKATREAFREQIPSMYGQKLYDRETMRRFGYDVVNASNYAATQLKAYEKQTRAAKQAAGLDRITADPFNDAAVDAEVKSLVEQTYSEGVQEGEPKELVDIKVKTKIGAAIEKIALARAKSSPDSSEALMNKFYKKGLMTGVQYEEGIARVRERGDQTRAILEGARIAGPDQSLVDSRKIGVGVRTDQLTPEMRDRASQAIAAAEEATGGEARITSAARTRGEQAALYDRFLKGRGGLAAPPGQSLHETGSALDMQAGPVLDKLREWYKSGELEKVYGLTMLPDSSRDPGHMQLAEGRKAYEKPTTPQASPEQRLVDMNRAAEAAAGRLMDPETGKPVKDVDPVRYQRYLDSLRQNVGNRAASQQKELNDTIKGLRTEVGQVMVQQLPQGRGPTNMAEGDSLDRGFSDKVERLVRLDPAYKSRIENQFNANARQDIPLTPEREANHVKYLGLNDQDRQRVDGNAMFLQGNITRGQANDIIKDQQRINRAAEQHSRVDPILLRHTTLLNDAQAFPSRTDKSANERYTWLRGAAVVRMQEHIESKKARMTPQEEDQMMESLVGEVVSGKYDGAWSYVPEFLRGTEPAFIKQSLEYPVTVNSKEQVGQLRSGQVYIYNGERARKK